MVVRCLLGATCGITFQVRVKPLISHRFIRHANQCAGVKTFVNTLHKSKATFNSYTQSLKSSSPDIEPSEAIEWLRSTAKSYTFIIPGASGYIDTAFDDIDAIRSKHGKEVDGIIREAYSELKEITSKDGMSLASASKAWEVLQKHLQRVGDLAGDAGQDILKNHPALKDKIGGNLDQLKQMGEKYGPEAKKQVEETTQRVKDIMKQGMHVDSIPKIQSLVQEKMQQIQKLGGNLWDESYQKAKPLLDKSPQTKNLVEENKEALKKSGNVQELYQKIQDAVSSGSTDDLKQYVDKVKEGNSGSGSGSDSTSGALESYLKMIPGGSQIVPGLTQLQSLAQNHGQEAEKIAKDTFTEIEDVLKRKVGEAQQLARDAEKDTKR